MKKLFLLFWILFSLSTVYVQGQEIIYPVHVNVNLVAPYSLYLSDYVSGNRDRLIVTLINRDVHYQSMPVRLRMTIKGNGFSLQTRPYSSVPPITLEPNLPYRLTVDDLRPYFDSRNLSSEGLGGDSFLKGKRMPEGMVEFGVEVLEYNTGKLLSRKGIGTAWLVLQKPPLLSIPFDGETLSWREPLNQLFQWTPQSTGSARVEYELIIKELWDNGMSPESAFAYSPEIFRERVPATSYLYGLQAPPLEAGHRYAWAVRVVPKEGADDENIVENDGLSEIRSFRVGRYCPPPANIKATAERGYIRVEWEGMPEHLKYAVSYRLQGSDEWHEEYSTFPSAMLPGIRAGHTYEYRVAGFCESEIPTYNEHVGKINVPTEDTARLRNCGVLRPVDLSNLEPLEGLADGDQFMAGDFPVHIQQVTGSQGYFTGHGYVHIPFLGNAPFKVTFDNIFVNTERRMVRGVVKTVYEASESGIYNTDDIFIGGSNTGKVVEGITKTDLSADFEIDPSNGFYFDETNGRIEITDEEGEVIGYIETGSAMTGGESTGRNDGNVSSVFPMTVRDTTGSLYRIDTPSEEFPASSSDVKKKLVVTPVGKSVDALDGDKVNLKRIDDDIARIVFKDCEGSRYAFDKWQPAYSQSYLIRAKYEQIGKDYHVPAKLLPSGKPDKVSAALEIKNSSVNPDHVVFRTAAGTEYRPESYDAKTKTWILTLVGGETDDGQELYALYPKSDGGYYNLGKLLVVTYPEYRFKVKIVPVSAELKEFDALRRTLQDIYARAGIECEVEKLPVFNYDVPSLFQKGSGLFSAYTPEMKALNAAYASAHVVEEDAAYLFVLSRSGHKKDRNFSGFMPLNKQYGYLFRDDFKDFEEFATAAAHELAHGRLSLKHPFDKSLGLSEGDLPDNLMDYRNGRTLAKWQWDVIHDPGVVVRIFERDKDAMIQGAFYDGIALAPLVDYKYHYNFGDIYSIETRSSELTCGRYNLTAHYNIDHDNAKKLSYYLAWCEVLKGSSKQYRTDYYIGANRLNEFKEKVKLYSSAADIFFMNGVPPQNMLQVLNGLEIGDLSEVLGGLGDMWGDALSDPMWWINIVNGSVSPKFLKPSAKFMGSFIQGLSDGAISLLNKTGRLGYKIKHIAGEVALYTNLEIEIARFNSRGILRPLHWGEAVGEKVLSLENIRFLKEGKDWTGNLLLYKSGNNYFWLTKNVTFKIGDKIGGFEVKNVKLGNNDKVAIIGRSMGDIKNPGVKSIYNELKSTTLDVEIFDQSSLTGEWKIKFDEAITEFASKTENWTKHLPNQELMKLKIYKLNKEWVQYLIEQEYTILDLGDFNNLGFSIFYSMEKSIIFKK